MKRARNCLVSCEPMENRLMFVTINGTSGANAISVSINGNTILYAVDGVSDSVSDIIHNEIEINGLGGNDTITIGETGANSVTVNGGAGADTINLALGANDMDAIEDFVTVNGDADSDTVTINDQNNQGIMSYTMSAANVFGRPTVPLIDINVENLLINAPTAFPSSLHLNVVPSPDVRFEGSASATNTLFLTGNGTQTVNYRPDDFTNGEGDITFNSTNIDFEDTEAVFVQSVSAATFTTPNVTDVLTVNKGATTFIIDGTSTGIAMTEMNVSGTPTVTIDMAANDSSGGNDSLTATGTADFVGLLRINAGTGNNTLNVNSGSWSMTTALGVGGVSLDVTINNATASFSGAQSLQRLELNNNGVASLSGNLSAQQLAVVSGAGTISVGSPNTATFSGTLSIGANRTLNKTGSGTLNINAVQSHGANSLFTAKGGLTNFNTDCGSISTRPLDLFADNGDINLNTTQHVDSVATNFGGIAVGANGNRVVVTNLVSIGGEGGTINLRDNDMIVDYTAAADAVAARALLRAGRNNGAWNGLGINSSTAAANQQHNTTLASLEATEFKSIHGQNATFDGQQLDNTMLLIKYTWYGDTDFNGIVDFDDYSRADAGFNNNRTGWLNGDFDDNGVVDFDDYSLIDQAFNTQGGVLRPVRSPAASTPVFRDLIALR
ncbi:MAG: hypothetical protein H7Z14_00075 [Anaerolineae bacterium]|nr:hypothetical protein [Phycisphaerae bacterium]